MHANPERKQFALPSWAEKLMGWALLTLLAVYTSARVSETRIEIISKELDKHEIHQMQMESDQVKRPEFSEFKDDLVRRLDRMENKIDHLQEHPKKDRT